MLGKVCYTITSSNEAERFKHRKANAAMKVNLQRNSEVAIKIIGSNIEFEGCERRGSKAQNLQFKSGTKDHRDEILLNEVSL